MEVRRGGCPVNPFEESNRQSKVRQHVRAAEVLLGRCGVTDFAAPGLADLIEDWEPGMWNTISLLAGATVCEHAREGERVCAECKALFELDFRGRPELAAALSRMGVR